MRCPLWITPGGGLAPGESPEAAARRELREETGLEPSLGPCIWTRRHVFCFEGRELDVREQFYFAHVAGGAVITDAGWEAAERRYMREHRWWTVDEIAAATASAVAEFAPRRLAAQLPSLLAGDVPEEPIDCGV
jgi:8-oxo-dGTP pyrophosphatase MutT (NUDIX family)